MPHSKPATGVWHMHTHRFIHQSCARTFTVAAALCRFSISAFVRNAGKRTTCVPCAKLTSGIDRIVSDAEANCRRIEAEALTAARDDRGGGGEQPAAGVSDGREHAWARLSSVSQASLERL